MGVVLVGSSCLFRQSLNYFRKRITFVKVGIGNEASGDRIVLTGVSPLSWFHLRPF